jgi:hypothetical protein
MKTERPGTWLVYVAVPDSSCTRWEQWDLSLTLGFPTAERAHAAARVLRRHFHGHLFAVRPAGSSPKPLPWSSLAKTPKLKL